MDVGDTPGYVRFGRAVRKAGEVIAVGTCAISGGVANLGNRSAVRQEFFAHEDRHHLPDLLSMAFDLFDSYWESLLAMRDRIGTWGDDGPSHYIATFEQPSTGRPMPSCSST